MFGVRQAQVSVTQRQIVKKKRPNRIQADKVLPVFYENGSENTIDAGGLSYTLATRVTAYHLTLCMLCTITNHQQHLTIHNVFSWQLYLLFDKVINHDEA